MATTDELQMMFNVVGQSGLSSMSDRHKVQQIAAEAALFALKLCREYELDARECALEIPYRIHRILNTPDDAFAGLKLEKRTVSGRGVTVRRNGVDYTSSANINKVIDPLFLDPAAGCGNFLVETYISLRTLENEIIGELVKLGAWRNERAQETL